MKNIFNKSVFNSLLVAVVLLSTSCEKELAKATADPTPEAYVSFHNFALKTGPSRLRVNDAPFIIAGNRDSVPYTQTTLGTYFGVTPGDVTIGARTLTGTANYASRSINVARNTYSSVFAYDTLTTGGTARILVLNNDMRAADTATTNIRFLHLSPNAGAVNVVLTRTQNQFGLAVTGTVINLSNVPYIGSTATPNEVALSTFTNIPAGTYRVEVLSGTTPVLTVAALTLRETKNYSIVARGFAPPRPTFLIPAGEALGASLILHNP